MEVKPVVEMMTQKLADTPNEESVADNKVMIHQLKPVQKYVKKLQRFSVENDVSDASQRAKDRLCILYEVEDEIEKFTFQVARHRKRSGFFMKQTSFFNKLNSCRRLKRKIKKIQRTISGSHENSITSSVNSNYLKSISNGTTIEEQDNDDEDDGFHYGTRELTQKSSSAVWPISEIPNTPSPKRFLTRSFSTVINHQERKLTFSNSYIANDMNVGFKQLSNICYQEEELGVFGVKDDVKSLVRRLTHQTKQKEMFVPILGEVGSGKTALARAVYRNRKIKDHFEFNGWISATEDYTSERIIHDLLKQLATFNGKRYLIVVDGVGSCGVLEDLKDAFPNVDDGSKIIFTSRRNSEMMKINPHIMKPLNEEESWNFFLKKVGKEKDVDHINPRLIYRILNICNGSPQNIVLMAGLLSTKIITEWSSAIDHYQSSDGVLTMCYNDLTNDLKLCMLYLALFPKDYDIPVRRLLRLWLAEGFVTRGNQRSPPVNSALGPPLSLPEQVRCDPSGKNDSTELPELFPEDIVQKRFEELVNRNMIQITKVRSDNSPRQCRVVSVFQDYLLPKATDISLFHIHRKLENFEGATGPFGVRRMVQHMSTTGALDCEQSQPKNPTFDPSLLRSCISFNFKCNDMPEKEVGKLLGRIISSNFRLLRVLDLERVCKPCLPDKLGHLCHLRYLGLRWTFVESLPESVGDLSYLETLDLKHTQVDSLPNSIWKLKKLRHLNLNNIRLAMPPSSSLTLLTLWGLLLDEKIPINDSLGKLLDLRELGIKFNLPTSQGALLDWIAKLVNLQSLRLSSVNDMGRPSKLVLKPLTNLNKLSHLNLYGHLERLPTLNEFPPSVKVLTLSVSKLNTDPMETLGQLPCLIVLRLLGDSLMGKKLVCHRGGFKTLEVLKLWKLNGLEEWEVEEGAMEGLKQLDIRSCYKLTSVSSRLVLKPKRLEEIILDDMPDEFGARIRNRKYNDTSLTINQSKFFKMHP